MPLGIAGGRWHIAGLLMLIASFGCGGAGMHSATPTQRVLSATDLHGGFEATAVLFDRDRLALDTRYWNDGRRGVVTTDVLDLGGDGILATGASVSGLAVTAKATIPEGSQVVVQVRIGTTYFQAPGTWSDWMPAAGVIEPEGRYVQVRVEPATTDAEIVPALESVKLSYRLARPRPEGGTVRLVSDGVQRIVSSPVEFGYERRDQEDLIWLRETFGLDKVIAGKETEFDKLHALMRWVARRPNDRHKGWQGDGPYPWHIRQVLAERGGGTIFGHCMSYCEVMLTAASALGWQGRHWAIHGVRDTSHEVPEIWIDELGKWVFFDPSLDTYYAAQPGGEPLSLIEMHRIYLQTAFEPGEVQQRGRHFNEERIGKLRGKHPIACMTGNYTYGKPAVWDWQWDHGYMTAGWMQLTPRNNWHSQPEPRFDFFGWGAEGYGGFPLYVDEQTPLPEATPENTPSAWHTRERDFWWTLNQASFRLTRSGETTLQVECGNSQPFFQRYLAKVGEGDWRQVGASFAWDLKPGRNRLELVPEDEFGKRGLSSVAVVEFAPAL